MHDFLMWAGGIVVTAIFSLIGWVLKMIFNALQKERDNQEKLSRNLNERHEALSASLSAHKLHAAETFATKQDVRDGFDRVMLKLDNIDDKLDRKADK